jgi:hypothetical protein
MYLASSPSRLVELDVSDRNANTATVTWRASPEKDIARYLVRWGPADEPEKYRAEVTVPRIVLQNAPEGTVVAVKAVNQRGLEGWDWARTSITAR